MSEENLHPIDEIEAAEDVQEYAESEADESVPKQTNTLTFKRSHLYAVLLPLAFVVGLSVGYLFWGRVETAPVSDSQVTVEQQVQRYEIPEDDDPVWGPDDAVITIIEFSDYECPYCRRWHTEVWPQIQEVYAGQVRLVYRDFPLTTIHANATTAATAANCAGEQNAYWEFSERLFSMELGLSKSAYDQYATDLGLDLDSFSTCLESGDQNEEVMADYEYAANLGVRSTPTFFINGIPVVGAQPFEVFQSLIDQELAGDIP
jgi:protein-disulfide isomerase